MIGADNTAVKFFTEQTVNFNGFEVVHRADGKKKKKEPKTKVGKALKKVSNSKVGKFVKDIHKLPANYVTTMVGKPMKMDTKLGKATGKVFNTAVDVVATVYTGGAAGAAKGAGKVALKTGVKAATKGLAKGAAKGGLKSLVKGGAKKAVQGATKTGLKGLLKKGAKTAGKKGIGGLLQKGKNILEKGKQLKEKVDNVKDGVNNILGGSLGADASNAVAPVNLPSSDTSSKEVTQEPVGAQPKATNQVTQVQEEKAQVETTATAEGVRVGRYVYPGGVRYD